MQIKPLSVAAIAIVATVSLSACGNNEAIENSDYKVISANEGLSIGWEFEDAEGNRTKMVNCRDGVFEKSCFETEDHLVRFEYRKVKSSLRNVKIFVDGVEMDSACTSSWGPRDCAVI